MVFIFGQLTGERAHANFVLKLINENLLGIV